MTAAVAARMNTQRRVARHASALQLATAGVTLHETRAIQVPGGRAQPYVRCTVVHQRAKEKAVRKLTVLVGTLVGPLVAAAATSAPANAAAFVERDRNSYVCGADPGDVPGLPGFDLANSTVVVTPTGALHVTCWGELPTGLSVPETYVGHAICRGDPGQADTTGMIVVTASGQVTITCLFPPSG